MRKIIVSLAMSLDGYIEGPDRDISWHKVDDELHRHFNEWLAAAGGFLEGRVTYELMAGVWPTAAEDPESDPAMVEFAPIWVNMPKIVYSRTLERADWNTTIVREVVPSEVLALKAEPGGDLVLGGPNLAATFMAHDLVDEYRLYLNPVVVGSGTQFFPPAAAGLTLHLAETRTFGNGVVLLRYERT